MSKRTPKLQFQKTTLWLQRLLCCVLLLIFGLFMSLAHTAQDERVALVIGNTQYVKSPLPNPVNDAILIAKVLESLGFKVTQANNLDRAAMLTVIKQFAADARGARVAFFYYSGHGLRGADGENYMQPIRDGDQIKNDSDIDIYSVPFSTVRTGLGEETGRITLLMFDACRNNLTIPPTRGTPKGLTRIIHKQGSKAAKYMI